MSWEPWSGALQVLLGGALTLAGGWLADGRGQRRGQEERTRLALAAVDDAAWDLQRVILDLGSGNKLDDSFRAYVRAVHRSLALLRGPAGRHRRPRRALADLLHSLTEDLLKALATWESTRVEGSRDDALQALYASSGAIVRLHTKPRSLRRMTKARLYELMAQTKS